MPIIARPARSASSQDNGEPFDVFPVNDPLNIDVHGVTLQKRDRRSYAILNQVAAEYRGEFMDDRLTVNAGVRLPFFKRDLENFCFTSSASGFVECSGQNRGARRSIAATTPMSSTRTARLRGLRRRSIAC